jgi:hypothetical protein
MSVQTVFKTDVDVVTTTLKAAGALGTGQIRYENGNQYTLYKASGDIPVKSAVVVSEYTGGEIITTVSGDNGNAVGIAQATAADDEYYWALTMGLATGISVQAMAAAFVTVGAEALGKIDDGSTGRQFALLLETAAGADADVDIWIF